MGAPGLLADPVVGFIAGDGAGLACGGGVPDGHGQLQVRQRIARLTLSQKLLEHGLRCQHLDYQSCPRFQAMVLARVDGVDLAQALDHD